MHYSSAYKLLLSSLIGSTVPIWSTVARATVNDNCNQSTGWCITATNSSTGNGGASFFGNCSSLGSCMAVSNGHSGAGLQTNSASGNGIVASTNANIQGIAAGFFTTNAGSNSTALAAENASSGPGLYASSNGGYAGYFVGNVNVTGQFESNGTCEFNCSSDERLKRNIVPLKAALDTLLQLKGVTFEWKNPDGQGRSAAGTQTGFIAQQVENSFPQWVGEDSKGFKTLTIQPNQIAALQVESIRALKADNDELKARVKALEGAGRSVISTNANGLGLGIAGIALAGALVVTRRKQGQERS